MAGGWGRTPPASRDMCTKQTVWLQVSLHRLACPSSDLEPFGTIGTAAAVPCCHTAVRAILLCIYIYMYICVFHLLMCMLGVFFARLMHSEQVCMCVYHNGGHAPSTASGLDYPNRRNPIHDDGGIPTRQIPNLDIF